MSPAEKVGQLFLITFSGSSISEGSLLRSLITTYHIGGFVLRADTTNTNFSGTDTLASVYNLIADMQTAAWDKSPTLPQHQPGRRTSCLRAALYWHRAEMEIVPARFLAVLATNPTR
jgi:hypothetical protein